MSHSVPPPDALAPGATLRHYKGGLYRVVGLCRIEATLKTGVLYQACQGDVEVVWMRPLEQFTERVTTSEGVVARFTVVTPAA
jgi:hypothetical protein